MERASAGIIMNFVEIMIGEKLKDADPALDIMGSDRKVLQVACQDFTNYLKFHWNLIGKEANQCEASGETREAVQRRRCGTRCFSNSLDVVFGLRNGKQRVKLLIGNQNANKWNKMSKTLANAEPLWRKIEHKQELQEVVVSTLIKNGEVCGTEILAENLLKMELGEKNLQNVSDKERVFVTLNNALRKAREMAQSKGPLIFVKVDKGYYNALNE